MAIFKTTRIPGQPLSNVVFGAGKIFSGIGKGLFGAKPAPKPAPAPIHPTVKGIARIFG